MKITSPSQAFHFFSQRMATEVEEFWIASLNAEKRVTAQQCLFRGTVDHCLFHPRDVFRFACRHNSSAILVAHNHPSGNVEPSPEDEAITERLLVLALLLEIPLVDHLIISPHGYFSFQQQGRLQIKGPVWPFGLGPDRC
jgi:DNA repair protein RadC